MVCCFPPKVLAWRSADGWPRIQSQPWSHRDTPLIRNDVRDYHRRGKGTSHLPRAHCDCSMNIWTGKLPGKVHQRLHEGVIWQSHAHASPFLPGAGDESVMPRLECVCWEAWWDLSKEAGVGKADVGVKGGCGRKHLQWIFETKIKGCSFFLVLIFFRER